MYIYESDTTEQISNKENGFHGEAKPHPQALQANLSFHCSLIFMFHFKTTCDACITESINEAENTYSYFTKILQKMRSVVDLQH